MNRIYILYHRLNWELLFVGQITILFKYKISYLLLIRVGFVMSDLNNFIIRFYIQKYLSAFYNIKYKIKNWSFSIVIS